jgi:hypothetical protein
MLDSYTNQFFAGCAFGLVVAIQVWDCLLFLPLQESLVPLAHLSLLLRDGQSRLAILWLMHSFSSQEKSTEITAFLAQGKQ